MKGEVWKGVAPFMKVELGCKGCNCLAHGSAEGSMDTDCWKRGIFGPALNDSMSGEEDPDGVLTNRVEEGAEGKGEWTRVETLMKGARGETWWFVNCGGLGDRFRATEGNR